MIVISDTAPIIFFAKIKKLSILKKLYSNIFIPKTVWEELIEPLSKQKKDIPSDIKYELKAKEEGWLIVKDPESSQYHEVALNLSKILGRGEAYAIALSLELKAELLLINDSEARKIAESKGLKTKWTTEVLLDAFEKDIINEYQEFEELMNEMIELGLWMKKSVYKQILDKAKSLKKQ